MTPGELENERVYVSFFQKYVSFAKMPYQYFICQLQYFFKFI